MRTAIFFGSMLIANSIGKGSLYLGGAITIKFAAIFFIVLGFMDILELFKKNKCQ